MARFAAGGLTTAGSTTNPIMSLYATAACMPRIREIGVFNTTATAVALKLVRLTTAGTVGANLVEAPTSNIVDVALATCVGTHTSTGPTLGADLGYRTVLGAAVGSGIIWTFEDFTMTIPGIANAGIGIIVENGTGQACQAYFVWVE